MSRNLEVYVDDLVIKSRTKDEIVKDIDKTFKTLREINMKLNPKKCTFGVEEELFLGYKINTKGLKNAEAEEAFKQMKQLIAKLSMLTAPMEKVELIVYLAASKRHQYNRYYQDQRWREDCNNHPAQMVLEQGLILTNPEWMEFTYALRFRFDVTNNEAEYEALISGLKIVEQMGVKNLQENVDSRLVTNQVNETYVAKETDMIRYLEKVKGLTNSFKAFFIKQIPRSKNKKADALSKMTSTSFAHLTDAKKSRVVKRKSWRFAVVNRTLYKKSFLGPWLRYVGPLQANYVLREIHKGSCSMHVERANHNLGEGIKARLDARSKNWMEELPQFLWAHSTMIKSINKDTSFSLTYETEAVVPVEIGMPTLRTAEVDLVRNSEALKINLDLLEERRKEAAIHEAKIKVKMEKYYNSKVGNTSFKPRDLLYRNNDKSRAKDTRKLGPK
uniref:Reverse transcriptase domain-containing protein n=1 Tax=Tanacetum cinerariifolium TaxID=118510 RepID=A0A6L2MCD2_TANCI|nr:reverse transcriptase domain-containing protein [Tanacetum cinerariifolium]